MPTARTTGAELEYLVATAVRRCRPGGGTGVLIGRLDQAEAIVELAGPGAAEAMADELAARVAGAIRSIDLSGRFGRHGWFAILEGLASRRDLELVANRIVVAGRMPSAEFGHLVTTSVGGEIRHDPEVAPTDLVGRSEAACRAAQAAGGDRYHRAGPVAGTNRLRFARDLRQALASDGLDLTVAPIVDAGARTTPGAGGAPVAYEAMVRWRSPLGGVRHLTVTGDAVLQAGLGPDLGRALVSLACQAVADLSDRQGEPVTVGIDLDPRWFVDQRELDGGSGAPAGSVGLAETVLSALAAHRIEPGQLQLDIDARLLMGGWPALVPGSLEGLGALGIRLALDHLDPSLATLDWLVHDRLFRVWKLDRIVAEQLPGSLARAGLDAVADLARGQGVALVAQGADDPDTLAALVSAGVTLVQGLAVGRPGPVGVQVSPG